MKEIRRVPSEVFRVEAGTVSLERWTVTRHGERLFDVPLEASGKAAESIALNHGELAVGARDPLLRCSLPFADIVSPGSDILGFGATFVNNAPICTKIQNGLAWAGVTSPLAKALTRYAYLRRNLAASKDEVQHHLCGLSVQKGRWTVRLKRGMWSGAKASMDSGHIQIEQQPEDGTELAELASMLVREFGEITIREAMRRHEPSGSGMLPGFNSVHYQYCLGVCSVIYCEADGKFVITRRGRNVHVNNGRVCAASGGVKWQSPHKRKGLFQILDESIAEEHMEEIGEAHRFRFVRVGFARELPREGSPEAFYTAVFSGTAEQVVAVIAANTHPDGEEIYGYVYALCVDDVQTLLRSADGGTVVHYKGLMNLYYSLLQMGLW